MTRAWSLLGFAAAVELVGFYALNISVGLSRVVPTLAMFAAFFIVYWLLARVMKRLPLGVAYALWSGSAVTLTSLMDLTMFGERLAPGQALGIGFIITGIVWLNLGASRSKGLQTTDEAS